MYKYNWNNIKNIINNRGTLEIDGRLFFKAEQHAKNALTEINIPILKKIYYLSGKNTPLFQYASSITEIFNNLETQKTEINNYLDDIANTFRELKRVHSTFAEDYYKESTGLYEILEKIENDEYLMTDDEKINEQIYNALLKLDEENELDYDMKLNYIIALNASKPGAIDSLLNMLGIEMPDLGISDFFENRRKNILRDEHEIIDILFYNPNIDLVGIDKYENSNDDKSVVNTFQICELYDTKTKTTYNIELGMDARIDLNDVFEHINDMPKNLKKENETILITNTSDPDDEYFKKLYDDPNFAAAASADDNSIKMYKWTLESSPTRFMKTLYHENAHNYDRNDKGEYTVSDSKEWKNAVKEDDNWASDYAKESYEVYKGTNKEYCEDFAESVEALYSDGPEEFTKNYPARAEILKELFPEMFE